MGTSTNGILAYGYDLGEDFAGLNDYQRDEPDWFDEREGWRESAHITLLKAHGFAETDWQADGFFERKREAEKAMGVELKAYCSSEYSMYLLAAKVQTCYRGDADPVDLTLPDNADERLSWALGVLGITPKADKPQWLLASYWG